MLRGGFTVLFFYVCLISFGQGIQKEIPLGSNTAKFGYLEYLPPSYPTGSSFSLIVFLHGIGERGNGTTDLFKVARLGIPRLITDGNWPVKNPEGQYPSREFIVISPQSATGFPTPASIHEFIDFLKSYYKVDKDRIYLTGLSAGGISTWSYLGSYNDQIAAAIPICGHANGYLNKLCISKDIPVWAFHGDADATVHVNGSINAINALKNCSPPGSGPHLLTIYNGTGHNSWTYTYNLQWIDAFFVDPYYDPFDISIYDWLLQYSKGGQLLVDLGQDKALTLPTNSITLTSSITSTNPITTYSWTKQSGPSATLVNASTSTLTVNGMVEGTYVFRLTVTDSKGITAYDEVTVTVLPEVVNQAPVANAGADQTIALPTNLTVFNGSGSDSDGSIATYAWTKVSGPAATLQNQNTASLTVSGLVQGSYVFGLTVTDDDGATGYDEVALTVEAANLSPTVNAGSDQTIQLPTNTIVLNGSASDPDGSITAYQWTKQSGPTATLQNATTANLTTSNLIQGTYIFRLTATDNDGAAAYDDVTVIVQAVNQAPVANAGADQNLKLPVNSTNIIGSGSDNDGNITAYQWTKVSGPSATLSNTTLATMSVSNMVEGTYVFGLTVTDDDNATGYDEVTVIVDAANVVPTADAGEDIVLYLPTNSTTITGIGADVDGSIVSYEWLKKTGPAATVANGNSPTVSLSNLVEGTYTFTLTVTDNEGASASDEVSIFVLVSNEPPVANAGADQNIVLPTNSWNINGSGSDSDGSIVSYAWVKVSGPAVTMNGENTATLQLTDLLEGTYRFGLTVTDDDGATGYDEVMVIVSPEPVNLSPSVTANNDLSITLPTNSVTLTSTANDPDGNIATYLWEKVSGPTATIGSSNTANTAVSNLIAGSYTFRITVTDNDGATASDNVNVTVYQQPVNENPVVNAGNDIAIRLPQSSVQFNPNVTDDGSIANVEWTQVTGPNTSTFDNNSIERATVSGLIAGVYTFRLTATDDQGASSSDEILVTVSEANQAPAVNAGNDITLQLPDNSVQITATASDPDGSISSYLWGRVSGPNGETITGGNTATVNITNLSEGIYVFYVTVTDNEGATASDQVKVTVQAENIIPTANAGNDITIRLPLNSTNVAGSGSDSDGSIVSYEWSKESGPMATMSNLNTPTLTLNDLEEGTYVFRLTVTDDDGASNFDDVQVIVLPEIANIIPVANAGPDQQVTLPTNALTLNGAGTDSDGSIAAYSWRKVYGPSVTLSNANSATLTLSNLVEGTYVFRLTVTDNDGDTDSDDVRVIVNPEILNQNPIANAGPDITITLPTNSLNINGSGSDPDGNITSYLWEKVSGPSVTMSNVNNSTLVLGSLVEGTYSFRLTVEDNRGATGTDLVMVTVHPADINQAPIANAGSNKSISLPTNTVVLNGSGSDADGSIASYQWQKVSGPSVTLSNANTATLTATSLVEGTYIFRLTVTDDDGAPGFDEARVVVVKESVNSNPIVNAGRDIIIQFPTTSALITAQATDKDGSISSYSWVQIAGTPANISGISSPTLTLTGLTEGTYKFRITVTDDDGASDFDEINVIVEPSDVNLPPNADAGQDLQIFLPTNSVNVTGLGSDNDGSIISYNWLKISGPAVTITNANKATVSFSDMIEGEYTFRFTVTDNDGGTAQDELKIYVTSQSVNQSPIAEAGDDIDIYLPNNSAEITGGGNDPDGQIVSYFWEQVLGPTADATGFNTNKLVLQNLIEGEYQFKLTVTDDQDAIGTDYITVTVYPEDSNLPPTVYLGQDIVEFLPLDSLIIEGNINDTDGAIVAYNWSKISGAGITQIPQDSILVLKDLIEGTYIFRLTVQDNDGATAFDDIIITINPVGTNRNPISNAGADIYISLPQDNVTLIGAGEDPDGDLITYEWIKISGPDGITMDGINEPRLQLSNLVGGTFIFELTVTDEFGASASDRVRLIVEPENVPPVANAGEDITLSFPVKDIVHVGQGFDEDGLIISYQWRMLSGPSIDNSIIYNDTLLLSDLKKGNYIYELLVMDNDSAVATDDILIKVISGGDDWLHAPKVFSPDGNGINDYWEISDPTQISGCQLMIFNRFGLKVYESNNYNNEWNGTYNGSALPEGDYYYVVKCNDGSETASGGVRIIRKY